MTETLTMETSNEALAERPTTESEEAPARKFLWTMETVYRAMSAGIFDGEPCDRLNMELIEGELIEKMTPNPPHWTAVFLIQNLLIAAFGSGHAVVTQSPLFVDKNSVPEPDVMVFDGRNTRLQNAADCRKRPPCCRGFRYDGAKKTLQQK